MHSGGKLVCMVGVDGTGKTTHARSLINEMRARGMRVHYVWCRGSPMFILPFVQIFKRIAFRQSEISPISNEVLDSNPLKRRLLSRQLLSRVWRILLVFDAFLQVLVGVRVPVARGRIVVCDRYIFDQMVDVAADLHFSRVQAQAWATSVVYRIFPKPDLILLLDLDEERAYARKSDSRPIAEIASRRKIYLWLSQIAPMIVIDTSDSFRLADQEIRRCVFAFLESSPG